MSLSLLQIRSTTVYETLKIDQKEGLAFRVSKCVFYGKLCDKNDIRPGRIKPLAIEYPRLTNVMEIRRFLGSTGYFRMFVKNYAHIASSLNRLTRKDVPFNWATECEIRKLINAITSDPILGIYDIEWTCHNY